MHSDPQSVLDSLNEWLVELNNVGGTVEFPVEQDWTPQEGNVLRPSSAGDCPRKLAYKIHYPEMAEEMRVRGVSVFLHGHTLHEQERFLIQQVAELDHIEHEVSVPMGDVGWVNGRIDGILQLEFHPAVLDVKGVSEKAFHEYARLGIPDHYRAQLNVYMAATHLRQAVLWVFNKNTADRAVYTVDYSPELFRETIAMFKSVQNSTPESLPDRKYDSVAEVRKKEPTGREYLPWQCVSEGTLVLTDKQWLPIEHIDEGDFVLTREGYRRVMHRAATGLKGNMVTIKPYGLMDMDVTDDHKILVGTSPGSNFRDYRERAVESTRFVAPRDLDPEGHHYLVYRFPTKEVELGLTDDDLFLIGTYIADGNFRGHSGKDYQVGITLHQDCADVAEKFGRLAMERGATSYKHKVYKDERGENPKHSLQLAVYGLEFADWIKRWVFGRKAHEKELRQSLITLPTGQQESLYQAMLARDGSIIHMRRSKVENYSTTSRVLALQVQQMLFRMGKVSSIVRQKPSIVDFGDGKPYQAKELWHVRHFPKARSSYGFFADEGLYYARLNSIVSAEPQVCYDLSIMGTHEFTTQGGVVHNCTYCPFTDMCWGEEGFEMVIEKGKPRWIKEAPEDADAAS